jgi:glycosyltransferase involved in cell wall biosynthesis
MACGTPVIAYRRGSVPEIVDHGVTGWIVGDDTEAIAACRRASMLDRVKVRRRFEERFTAERMVRDYVELYQGRLGVGSSVALMGAAAADRIAHGRVDREPVSAHA